MILDLSTSLGVLRVESDLFAGAGYFDWTCALNPHSYGDEGEEEVLLSCAIALIPFICTFTLTRVAAQPHRILLRTSSLAFSVRSCPLNDSR